MSGRTDRVLPTDPGRNAGILVRAAVRLMLVSGFVLAQPSWQAASLDASDPRAKPIASDARNAGPFTVLQEDAEPAAQVVGSDGVQDSWRSRQWMTRTAPPGPRLGYAFIGSNFTLVDPGSQKNGPANAGYAQNLTVLKQGFPSTSARNGEIDALLINGRQAGPTPAGVDAASDINGIQINVQQAGDPGFAALVEGLVSRIDATTPYATTQAERLQVGAIDPFGKNGEVGHARYTGVDRLTFGYGAGAEIGALDRAFYAFDTGGTWADYLYAGRPGLPALRVKGGSGDVVFGPDGSAWTLHRANTGTFQILGADGMPRLTVSSTDGALSPTAAGRTTAASGVVAVGSMRVLDSVAVVGAVSAGALMSAGKAVQTVPDSWTAFTPKVTFDQGSTATGSAAARYEVVGKRLTMSFRLDVTLAPGGRQGFGVFVTLPVGLGVADSCVGSGRNESIGKTLQIYADAKTRLTVLNYDNSSFVPPTPESGTNVHHAIGTITCEIE